MNDVTKKLFVAKISLDTVNSRLINLGLYPNGLDCFLISEKSTKKMETSFQTSSNFGKKDVIISPIAGDKFIGAYRDKGSITQVMKKFVPFVKYYLQNKEEVANLISFLEISEVDPSDIFVEGNVVTFPIDLIAHESTDRDNVSALLIDSCLELECILEDKEITLSLDEAKEYDLFNLIERRKHSHEVVLLDSRDYSLAYSFGEVPILLEDFFWQPNHGNRYACEEKECSFHYNQALDAMAVLTPTLYKAVKGSVDFASVCEDLAVLGMSMGTRSKIQYTKQDKKISSIEEDFESCF